VTDETHRTPATGPTDEGEPAPRTRQPKPSERLCNDASRVLSALLDGGVGIETIAALARSSESTIRRFHGGATGSRASVSNVTLAVVVATCQHAPKLIDRERAVLIRLSREHTPGAVGLALPQLEVSVGATRKARAPRASAEAAPAAGEAR
jgi:hypothetical protein